MKDKENKAKKDQDNNEKKEEDQTSSRRRAKTKKSHPVRKIIGGVVMLAVFLGVAGGAVLGKEYFRKTTKPGKNITVTIKRGENSRKVASKLQKKGVILYQSVFLVKLSRSPYQGKIRYGTYQLNSGMTVDAIIKKLATTNGQEDAHTLVVPGGYSAEQIGAKLEKKGAMTSDEFLAAVTKAAATSKYASVLPDAKDVRYQLQGFLYPGTYYLGDNITPDQLVKDMLDNFDKHWTAEEQKKADAAGMTVVDVLNRASLCQMETYQAKDYPMVAAVISNRLNQKMRLQFDSTVVYAISDGMYGVKRVLYTDLQYPSPYNTYLNDGLPAGPISNPSQEAINGVLSPAKNDYLYFQYDASKNDGSNIYFKTYEEHKAAQATASSKQETTSSETQSGQSNSNQVYGSDSNEGATAATTASGATISGK